MLDARGEHRPSPEKTHIWPHSRPSTMIGAAHPEPIPAARAASPIFPSSSRVVLDARAAMRLADRRGEGPRMERQPDADAEEGIRAGQLEVVRAPER